MTASSPLLFPDEAPSVQRMHPSGRRDLLLVCDHASRAVPRALGDLGLPDGELARHIGWDIGAAGVTRHLTGLLDAPALLTGYSRLVVDCNRNPADPTCMPEISDGTGIPGNRGLDETARRRRLDALFEPYHTAIGGWIADSVADGTVPSVISVHSFTPVMGGFARPWHVGILWNRDPRIAVPLLAALEAEGDLVVGDNEPYSARTGCGHTINVHCEPLGVPSVMLEIRQDLIEGEDGQRAWAERLARLLRPILAGPELRALVRW